MTARGVMVRGVAVALAIVAGCSGPSRPNTDMRLWTQEFAIRAWPNVVPPRSLEPITWTLIVTDKKTRQPIANGQGRIFATNADGVTKWDGFRYGPEVGMYRATFMYPAAGEWAMAIQFRRDSTLPLQKTEDWKQIVRAAAEPGSK
ncbi:MAG: hypothetical protein K2X99_01575 [Gemmatimonadaceae bacterium]|nr:hypothetical protein [Gemmatimonadaceae bacterium]